MTDKTNEQLPEIIDKQEEKSFFPNYSYKYKSSYASNSNTLNLINAKKKGRGRQSAYVDYTKDDIITFLRSPERYEKQIRQISKVFYNTIPQYRRAVTYFARMARFDHILKPVNIDPEKEKPESLYKQYLKVSEFVERMNIKHEFAKILISVQKEDIFYGYEHLSKDSYFIQKLDPDFCQVSSITDGIYNVAFDFTFFDKNEDQIDLYPPEFKKKYNKYKNNKDLKLQELEGKNTIVIKANEETEVVIPPLAGAFESILELSDYKKLRKATKQIGAYKLLSLKIPMFSGQKEELNGFMVDYDTFMEFHTRASESLPEEIGVLTTPFEAEAVDFSKNIQEEDDVAQAERDMWNGIGISQSLFNTDKTSSASLNNSIIADEQLLFALYRQFERWINRRLRAEFTNAKFKVEILDTTTFNYKDKFKEAKESATLGLPMVSTMMAVQGKSPIDLLNMNFLEDVVFNIKDKLRPLSTSYTEVENSNSSEGGAPEKDVNDLTDEGLKTKDKEKNE